MPAQPSSFEAEAELDTRIMLSWLWPVQDPITKYELNYWEANSENDKVEMLWQVSASLSGSLSFLSLALALALFTDFTFCVIFPSYFNH